MAIEDEGWPLFNGYLFVYFIVVCVVSECQFLISEVAVIGERRFVLSIKEVQMSVHWKSTPSAHKYSNTQLECVLSVFQCATRNWDAEALEGLGPTVSLSSIHV